MHKTRINSLDSTLEFNGASPRKRLKQTEEEKAQASRPRGVGPAGLQAVEIIIYTQYIGCGQGGVSQKDVFG